MPFIQYKPFRWLNNTYLAKMMDLKVFPSQLNKRNRLSLGMTIWELYYLLNPLNSNHTLQCPSMNPVTYSVEECIASNWNPDWKQIETFDACVCTQINKHMFPFESWREKIINKYGSIIHFHDSSPSFVQLNDSKSFYLFPIRFHQDTSDGGFLAKLPLLSSWYPQLRIILFNLLPGGLLINYGRMKW